MSKYRDYDPVILVTGIFFLLVFILTFDHFFLSGQLFWALIEYLVTLSSWGG